METRALVTAEDLLSGETTHTNTAFFVYVALDESGRPTPVPSLICETEEQKARFDRAKQRQEYRLEQRRQGIL